MTTSHRHKGGPSGARSDRARKPRPVKCPVTGLLRVRTWSFRPERPISTIVYSRGWPTQRTLRRRSARLSGRLVLRTAGQVRGHRRSASHGPPSAAIPSVRRLESIQLMWNGMSSRYNQVLCERDEPRVRRWKLSGRRWGPDIKTA